jgi:hypothetical protein
MPNDHVVHPRLAEGGKKAPSPARRRYNDARQSGERTMNRTDLRLPVACAALAMLFAGGSALAGPVCIDPLDPQCAKQTDDPQPNVGDVAPGMTGGGIAVPPAMSAPAMAAPRAYKPTPPEPEPGPLPDPAQDDEGKPAQ